MEMKGNAGRVIGEGGQDPSGHAKSSRSNKKQKAKGSSRHCVETRRYTGGSRLE